jgi:hypothetical protein
LEAQISTTPVWSRQTQDYIKNEGAIEIKIWSCQKLKTNQPAVKKSLNPVIKDEPKEILSVNVNINKIEGFDFGDFEKELKEIENNWKEKYQTTKNEESVQTPKLLSEIDKNMFENNMNEQKIREEKLRVKSEILKKKFLESIEIHKKPDDFKILKNIFTFKVKNEKNEIFEVGHGHNFFEIDSNSLKQLLFIEYIIQRVDDLLTKRTKAYILENEEQSKITLNEERQIEEFEESCDQYVAEKGAFFNNIGSEDNSDSAPAFSTLINNSNRADETKKHNEANYEEDELDMLSKLKDFEDVIKQSSTKKSEKSIKNEVKKEEKQVSRLENEHFEYSDSIKKPLPDYNDLREEAVKQQLKIKEFFSGRPAFDMKKSTRELTIIDENDGSTDNFSQNLIFKFKETNEEIVRVLPEIDSKSQFQIRRKIFYEKLIN